MRRYRLRAGDRSSAGGRVLDGLTGCTLHGVPLTYVGARVECPACGKVGRIAAIGARGQEAVHGHVPALEGDQCACACDPPPTLMASQRTDWVRLAIEEPRAREEVATNASAALHEARSPRHWIGFHVLEPGNLGGLICRAHFADGSIENGMLAADGRVHFPRTNREACQKFEVCLPVSSKISEPILSLFLKWMNAS